METSQELTSWFCCNRIHLTCPCMFIMTTVLDRLHTTKCSGFLGSRITLFTVMSVPAEVPRDLNVLVHSVVFIFQTWTSEKMMNVLLVMYFNVKGLANFLIPSSQFSDWEQSRTVHTRVSHMQKKDMRVYVPSQFHRRRRWWRGGHQEWMRLH